MRLMQKEKTEKELAYEAHFRNVANKASVEAEITATKIIVSKAKYITDLATITAECELAVKKLGLHASVRKVATACLISCELLKVTEDEEVLVTMAASAIELLDNNPLKAKLWLDAHADYSYDEKNYLVKFSNFHQLDTLALEISSIVPLALIRKHSSLSKLVIDDTRHFEYARLLHIKGYTVNTQIGYEKGTCNYRAVHDLAGAEEVKGGHTDVGLLTSLTFDCEGGIGKPNLDKRVVGFKWVKEHNRDLIRTVVKDGKVVKTVIPCEIDRHKTPVFEGEKHSGELLPTEVASNLEKVM